MMTLRVVLASATTGVLVALPLACGSIARVVADASADSAGPDLGADGPVGADGGGSFDGAGSFDAGWGAAEATDAAACGDASAPFACAGRTCSSGVEFCARYAKGLVPFDPLLGCNPLPASCTCAAERTCECLGALPSHCACSAEAGAITVLCSLP